ncbi:DUF202 domain-containing protein [Microbacterium trichothecenolyticum]|uniref:DUF202 domain-containing protein n=1 Tax=Microbacterium trichothecenolyticum TaxID=69370 RepID=UPI0035BE8CD7
MTPLFDDGLQPERTELAWRRTALALAVGSLVAFRLLPSAFGDAWWALGGVAGLLATTWLYLSARRRYRRVNEVLRVEGDRARMPGGGVLGILAVFILAVGVTGLAVVLAVAVRGGATL